ncbi:hypothetical protein [Dechloromonas sp. A34]|uniref:hypothetical protein n=1 Tax=Dechloromonas sp. A34 TaxID=447588 RepID=UPI0022496CEE|nr:hypothetical protein [Dechloromonas sp. A34]
MESKTNALKTHRDIFCSHIRAAPSIAGTMAFANTSHQSRNRENALAIKVAVLKFNKGCGKNLRGIGEFPVQVRPVEAMRFAIFLASGRNIVTSPKWNIARLIGHS